MIDEKNKEKEVDRMKVGNKLKPSFLAEEQGVCKNWKNLICTKLEDKNGLITIKRDGIENPRKRVSVKMHKDFFVLITKKFG